MSVTRQLVCRLRERLGHARPLAPVPPLPPLEAPPARVFPSPRRSSHRAEKAAQHTTALVGIGHVGTRYATDVVLQFQAELAVAHEAVAAVLPEGWPEEHGLLPLRSRVRDHHEYLLRPDLGRRLDESSVTLLRERAAADVDVQPIVADGLSAVACMGAGLELLEAFTRACERRGWRVGTPMAARFARVWLEDEIGETVRAKVAVIMLGERPGLGTGDGLSAYMVYEPRVGKTDGERNMISNIHARGTSPAQAAERLAMLAGAMMDQQSSGVSLDLRGLKSELGEAATAAYRAPEPRQRLVELP
jgi:ethanolamine ammonia-lyase small subunit